jgi:polyferredoxin
MPHARTYILTPVAPAAHTRKPFVRRHAGKEQLIRQSVQMGFLLLNVWVGAQFYLFVRHYETGGLTTYVARPPGVEGWLPIAALMNLKLLVLTGEFPHLHPAGLTLLVAFLGISILLRKAFCSWLCPIGTISEWLWQGGEAMFGRTLRVWRPLDIPLRSLKYILLGLFLYAVGSMSAGGIVEFLQSPYGLIADVKMLNFFRAMGTTAAVVIAILLIGSVFVKNLWCRYLCPYGALMGIVALASPTRIQRNPDLCIDCGKCARACPAALPVDTSLTIRSAECSACMQCVTACPAAGALDLTLGRRRALPAWSVAAAVLTIFLGLVGLARITGHWHTLVDDATYFSLIPDADRYGHPGR